MESYRTTLQSQRMLDDLCLASQVEAALVNNFNVDRVIAREGSAHVTVIALPDREAETASKLSVRAQRVDGVKAVSVNIAGPVGAADWSPDVFLPCLDLSHRQRHVLQSFEVCAVIRYSRRKWDSLCRQA